MANRRYLQTITTRLYSNSSLQYLKTITPNALQYLIPELPKPFNPKLLFHPISPNFNPTHIFSISCNFSTYQRGGHEIDSVDGSEDDDGDHEGEEMEEGFDDDYDDDDSVGSGRVEEREYTVKERENEAATIGYKVIGQLERSDRAFKLSEPVFAVIQEDEFHRLADSTIQELLEKIEEYGDTVDVDDFDIDYGNQVLTVKFGSLGTYVLNKQTPNRQIWMSSPLSGPSRFDWDRNAEAWIYRRNKANLSKLLEDELEELCGKAINLS